MENKPPIYRQKNLFGKNPTKPSSIAQIFSMYVDGASRGNPGQAGIGIFCHKIEAKQKTTFLEESKPVLKNGFYLGHSTNNIAEYMALLCGLFLLIKKLGIDLKTTKHKPTLQIYSDSQLMVNQLKGIYKTKDIEIQTVKRVMDKLLLEFNWEITHVLRDKNVQADRLANSGIDQKTPFDRELSDFLKENDLLELFIQ